MAGPFSPRDLRLGDEVQYGHVNANENYYATMTVTNITKDEVILKRPYVVTGDWQLSSGVSWSLGVEEIHVFLDSSLIFRILSRKNLK